MDKTPGRLLQIDLIKAIAIILVIFGHTFAYTQVITGTNTVTHINVLSFQTFISDINAMKLTYINTWTNAFTKWITYSALSMQQTVPIFIALMGFNYGLSYRRRGYKKLSDIYQINEYSNRCKRFLIPFLICFIGSLFLGAILYLLFHIDVITLSVYNLIGYLPINGPGNYFIPLVFQFLLIFPILYVLFNCNPRLTIIGCFLVALLYEFLTPLVGSLEIYMVCIIRFLPLLALGLWISTDNDILSRKNRWILLFSIFSLAYLIIVNQTQNVYLDYTPFMESQNLFASFYQILLILIGIKILPKNENLPFLNIASLIGKASYHIFLVQIIYFGANMYANVRYNSPLDILKINNIMLILFNLAFCITIGTLFYYAQNRINTKLERNRGPIKPLGIKGQ